MNDPYFDTPVISRRQLQEAVTETVKQTLERLGIVSPYVSRQEALRLMGRARYDRGVELGLLNPVKKGGRTSTVEILRSEVEDYLRTSVLKDNTDKPLIIKRR